MSPDAITHLLLTYRYIVIIPLSFIEGPIIAFIAGTLSFAGYFDPVIMFFLLLARDIILDSFMYGVGRFASGTAFAHRLLKRIRVEDEHLEEVRGMWEHHGFRTMFFSKLSYGVSAAFLIVGGLVHTPFSRFFFFGAIVAALQYGGLFILGYFFGDALGAVSNIFTYVQYLILAASVVGIGWYVFTRFMRTKLDEEREEEKHEQQL